MKAFAQLPGVQITVDGAPLSAEYARLLSEICVQQVLSLPSVCELSFSDPRGRLAGAEYLLPGTALGVAMAGQSGSLFRGEVTGMDFEYAPSGSRVVRVRACDRLQRLRNNQPVATHIQVTLAELAREMLSPHGIAVDALADTPVQRQLVQFRQSDLALLEDLAARNGLFFVLRDEVLHILSLRGIGDAIPLRLGSSLLEASVELNNESVCRRVDVVSWDPWLVQNHRGQVDEPRDGRDIGLQLAPAPQSSGQRTVTNGTAQDDRQAEACAQGELDRRVAGEIGISGFAEGDPRLCPGTPVSVYGLAAPLEGRYVLTETRHTIDAERGYVTKIATRPPPAPARQPGVEITPGRVTRVDDPEGLGRVRVALLNCGDIESDWLGVLLPAAGEGKGLIVLPDVQDSVLVLFTGGDPAQALVLGGLYGATPPPDAGVEAGAVQRYTLMTPGGQRIRLDDARQEVRVENRHGNFLQLSPGGVTIGSSDGSRIEMSEACVSIRAKTALEIEAAGQSIVIRGDSIDFERA